MCVLEMGLLYTEHYLGSGFLSTLTSLLFHKRYVSIKECEKITSLVGVLCMKRKKIEALYKNFLEEEKDKS
jgi:hypothetical protein